MFYGSGAGKLPTASAVVADIVAEVKNPHTDIMNFWTEEKLQLEDRLTSSKRFLVRMTVVQAEMAEKIREDFGEVTFINPEGIQGEFGVLTSVMTEGEYEEKAKVYPQICHMIRVEE